MGAYFNFERKFGHLGISGLIRILAVFRLISWLLCFATQFEFMTALVFDWDSIMRGEVWRLVSWILVPRAGASQFAFLYALIEIYFLFFISDGLERAWGPFGVTLFLFSTCFLAVFTACLISFFVISDFRVYLSMSLATIGILIIAFACLYPNIEIMLMLVLPIKMKYVGMLIGLMIALQIFNPILLAPVVAPPVLAAMIPLAVVFLPGFIKHMKQQSEVAARRSRFEREKLPASEAFHQCGKCGATEVTQPDREFRIADDGEEYCNVCSAERQGGA